MHIVKLPKGKGKGFRTIYVPNRKEMPVYKKLARVLRYVARDNCRADVVHGFMPHRSPVTNAVCHVGYEYTVNIDLQDFFDNVTPKKFEHPSIQGLLSPGTLRRVLIDGAARQGLPTSPHVANIAAIPLDEHILRQLAKAPGMMTGTRYTRYADDLTFSTNSLRAAERIFSLGSLWCQQMGFPVNHRKTKLQCAKQGVRKITGVGVDEARVRPLRKNKRKLRAMRHRMAKYQNQDPKVKRIIDTLKSGQFAAPSGVIPSPGNPGYDIGYQTVHDMCKEIGAELVTLKNGTLQLRLPRSAKLRGLAEWCECRPPRRARGIPQPPAPTLEIDSVAIPL